MLALVTGASSGIGEAVAEALARSGWRVLAIGRRIAPLTALATRAPLCIPLAADVTTPEGVESIRAWVETHGAGELRAVVHNAGTLGPIKPLLDVTTEELQAAMALNVYAPLEITRALLPFCADGARVLHVSSGAAHAAIAGWGCYCVCKAAFFQAYQVLRTEAASQDASGPSARAVLFGSVRPGTVTSGMQDALRASSFPAVDRFRALHERRAPLEPGPDGSLLARAPPKDGLDDPRNVAVFVRWLVASAPAAEFGAAEWDVRDAAHHGQWVGTAW